MLLPVTEPASISSVPAIVQEPLFVSPPLSVTDAPLSMETVVPDSNMKDIIHGSLIFIIPLALGILGLIAFPDIALFLVKLMK